MYVIVIYEQGSTICAQEIHYNKILTIVDFTPDANKFPITQKIYDNIYVAKISDGTIYATIIKSTNNIDDIQRIIKNSNMRYDIIKIYSDVAGEYIEYDLATQTFKIYTCTQ